MYLTTYVRVVCLYTIAFCFYHSTQVKATYILRAKIYYLSFCHDYIMCKP